MKICILPSGKRIELDGRELKLVCGEEIKIVSYKQKRSALAVFTKLAAIGRVA